MIAKQSLAVALSRLKHFEQAKMEFEQYATESELAAELLWHAYQHGHLEGKRILDLGAGTGILAVGAALMGAKNVIAVEKDLDAIRVLKENLDLYEGVDAVQIVESDIAHFDEEADVVIMNPPFGTKERHADRAFLDKATRLAPVIYTIHKETTDQFVRAFAHDAKYDVVLAETHKLALRHTMAHHERQKQEIKVNVYCLIRKN